MPQVGAVGSGTKVGKVHRQIRDLGSSQISMKIAEFMNVSKNREVYGGSESYL